VKRSLINESFQAITGFMNTVGRSVSLACGGGVEGRVLLSGDLALVRLKGHVYLEFVYLLEEAVSGMGSGLFRRGNFN